MPDFSEDLLNLQEEELIENLMDELQMPDMDHRCVDQDAFPDLMPQQIKVQNFNLDNT